MNLIWIDIETTGLSPSEDIILEVAAVATNEKLEELGEMSFVINVKESSLLRMDAYVCNMHTKNGLLEDIFSGKGIPLEDAERNLCDFVRAFGKGSPMGGNSPHFDRSFLKLDMPELEKLFNHQSFDASTLIKAASLVPDRLFPPPRRDGTPHRALSDIRNSVEIARTVLGMRWQGEHPAKPEIVVEYEFGV